MNRTERKRTKRRFLMHGIINRPKTSAECSLFSGYPLHGLLPQCCPNAAPSFLPGTYFVVRIAGLPHLAPCFALQVDPIDNVLSAFHLIFGISIFWSHFVKLVSSCTNSGDSARFRVTKLQSIMNFIIAVMCMQIWKFSPLAGRSTYARRR